MCLAAALVWVCVGASTRDLSTLSMLSLAVPIFLARYVQVILTEVISSQYDNPTHFTEASARQMAKQEDREGEGK